MLHTDSQLGELFKVETTSILDYKVEWERGMDLDKFPEFNNELFRFCSTDGSTTTGKIAFADVESGASLVLKFKTMPVRGYNKYFVGEPFYFYDVRGELIQNGELEEVVLVDEQKELKKVRPFLMY